MRPLTLTDIEVKEFWQLITKDRPNKCWIWHGFLNHEGYGYYKGRRANRIAYALTYGYPKHLVLHKCRNKSCCNPTHLYDGTHKQNMKDMTHDGTHDGRNRRSEQHPCAKLSNNEVIMIRNSSDTGNTLAKQHGVSPSTISSIRHRTRWIYL